MLVGIVLLVGIISGCVEEEKAENKKPTASFTFLPTTGIYVGVEITFTDASTDDDGTIAAWSWDTGDGTTSNESGPIKHTYDTPGTYTVKLIVTDDDGADSEEYSVTIEVTNVPPKPSKKATTKSAIRTQQP